MSRSYQDERPSVAMTRRADAIVAACRSSTITQLTEIT